MMCSRDDDPSVRTDGAGDEFVIGDLPEPAPAGIFDGPTCPLCDHAWGAHMTRESYESAHRKGYTPGTDCPLCRHPWWAHMTREHYETAHRIVVAAVGCVTAQHPERGDVCPHVCGCVAIVPDRLVGVR